MRERERKKSEKEKDTVVAIDGERGEVG